MDFLVILRLLRELFVLSSLATFDEAMMDSLMLSSSIQ